jgi:hypothetical protein
MSDEENEETFDAEELTEGFDEEVVGEGEGEEGSDEGDDESAEEEIAATAAASDEDDVLDDADVELALDEVLAETILRTGSNDDEDEDAPAEVDTTTVDGETILPKQDDEFRCASCRLLKKQSQLADKAKSLCRDCV